MKNYIIGSAFVAVFVLTGCTDKTEELQSSNAPAQQAVQEESAADNVEEGNIVPAEKLKDLFSGFMEADYRVVIVSEGGTEENQLGDMTMEYDAPEKMHTTMKSEEGTTETIILPDAMYMRQNDEQWVKIPTTPMNGEDDDNMAFTQDDLDELTMEQNIRYEGKEKCGTGMCDVYSIKDEDAKTTMYIDVKKKRPVKMIVLSKDGHKMTMTYEYTDITIKAPTENITEVPVPGAGGEMSEEDLAKMMEAFGGMEQ